MKQKRSKKEVDLLQKKKDFKLTTRAVFIIGILFLLLGFKRFFQENPSIMLNSRTNYPVLDHGNYPIFIGSIMIILGLYRIFFLKKP